MVHTGILPTRRPLRTSVPLSAEGAEVGNFVEVAGFSCRPALQLLFLARHGLQHCLRRRYVLRGRPCFGQGR